MSPSLEERISQVQFKDFSDVSRGVETAYVNIFDIPAVPGFFVAKIC